jgi:hypothetical protein
MNRMINLIIGAIIFTSLDRAARVISTSIVDQKMGQRYDIKKTMLRIELLTLFVALFIAIQFVNF